jgi:hypothetical protein
MACLLQPIEQYLPKISICGNEEQTFTHVLYSVSWQGGVGKQ